MKIIIKSLIRYIYEFALFLRICKPRIIVRVDGGICSQMHQYLLGYLFMKKGYNVRYDLTWFKDYGMDLNNRDVRNFDLLKVFPYLNFVEAGVIQLKFYRYYYNYEGSYPRTNDISWINITPPRLLTGYYADPDFLYSIIFKEIFTLKPDVLDATNRSFYDGIEPGTSAAVHVRRGDLSVEVNVYGKPASLNYFKEAFRYLKERSKVTFFYLFSDDKSYLIDELIPYVGLANDEYLILNNGSDKGYMDMILMSKCNYIITSKGTLGKYAALLDLNSKKEVIVCKDDKQTYMLDVEQIKKIAI